MTIESQIHLIHELMLCVFTSIAGMTFCLWALLRPERRQMLRQDWIMATLFGCFGLMFAVTAVLICNVGNS